MQYSANCQYFTKNQNADLNTTTSSRARRKSILTASDRVNSFLNKIPFPPSFGSFNGVKIILFIIFLHRIHFYSVFAFISNLSSIRSSDHDSDDADENSAQSAHAFIAFAFMLGPLPGILADKYFGRPKMLSFCLLLCFLGSCAQSIFHSLFEFQKNIPGLIITKELYYSVHITVVIVLILGSSGITALMLPYGVDQMEDAGETRMSSYFYWLFWSINMGGLMSFGRYFVYSPKNSRFSLLSSSYLATISSFLAAIIFRLSQSFHLLHRGPNIGTPLKKIFYVTRTSLVIWYQRRSEQNYHENLPILDYSKTQHYGGARFEMVEDVKAFYRIVFVLLSLFGYFSIYHLVSGFYTLQAQEVVREESPYLSSLVVGLIEGFVITITIPIMRLANRIPKPYTAKILYRVEVGICLAFLSVVCASLVSVFTTIRGDVGTNISTIEPNCGDDNPNIQSSGQLYLFLLVLPQTVVMGISEIFAIVATYEFVYAQSPGDMKGFTFGILNTVYGLGSYFSTVVAAIIEAASDCPGPSLNNSSLLIDKCSNCALPYAQCIKYDNLGIFFFVIFSILSLIYLIYFFVVVIKYKRRDRQEIEKWYCT
ncbi:Solute carrier family 15 member 4-like [Oopsacas minuta]|uniref:Solute carrier family 15 member 4-like n=1 Tax=Oopsacas minuta TaxID=111878 RepID=A0AAV7KI66_9METZ|nr:Solute carrier family 15 member 4-like [Oopsacas minuta]